VEEQGGTVRGSCEMHPDWHQIQISQTEGQPINERQRRRGQVLQEEG